MDYTDESPQLRIRRNTRLSFRKKPQSESPKTPIHKAGKSPDFFNISAVSATSSPISTPVNRRKRAFFSEESPSQMDDSFSSAQILSQEVRTLDVDVGWKWDEGTTVERKYPRPAFITRIQSELTRKTKPVHKSPIGNTKKGFYKFEEELMSTVNCSSIMCTQIDDEVKASNEKEELIARQTRSAFKKSPPSIDITCDKQSDIKIDDLNPVNEKVEDRANPNSEHGMLDDSDLDNLLLQCSEEVETSQNSKNRKTPLVDKKITEFIDSSKMFEQDSFDDILLTLPDGGKKENKNHSSPKTLEIFNHNKAGTSKDNSKSFAGKSNTGIEETKRNAFFDDDPIDDLLLSLPDGEFDSFSLNPNKSNFSRYNSMPVSPAPDKKKATSTLTRYNSLPTRDAGGSAAKLRPGLSLSKR